MTLTFDIIVMQYRNTRVYHLNDCAKCFVSDLHIRVDMQLIDIHRILFSNGHCLKLSNCNGLQTGSQILICVYDVSIVFEISRFTVKMACKTTSVDNYKF